MNDDLVKSLVPLCSGKNGQIAHCPVQTADVSDVTLQAVQIVTCWLTEVGVGQRTQVEQCLCVGSGVHCQGDQQADRFVVVVHVVWDRRSPLL